MSKAFRDFVSENAIAVEDHAEAARDFCRLECDPRKSRTKQADKDSTDINKLVRRYIEQGVPLPPVMPQFGDASEIKTLQDALELSARVSEFFATIPAPMREKFRNDPQEFLRMSGDPRNRGLFEEMGLLKPEKVEPPPAVGGAAPGTGPT